jgi:hypothetical protein
MIWRQRLRIVAALVVLVALAGPAFAAPPAKAGTAAPNRVWAWLVALLPWNEPPGVLSLITADQCSSSDLDGHCLDGLFVASPDKCSSIDPNGQCLN